MQVAWNEHWEVEKNFISVGINSETPVMLVYAFLILLHWKGGITKLWITTHFCTTSGWTPRPHTLNHNRAAGNPRERKAKLKSPRYAFKFQKISKFHWVTESHKIPVEDTHSWPSLCLQRAVSHVCILNGWNPKPKLFINRLKISSSTWKEHLNSLRRRAELKQTLEIMGRIAAAGKTRRGLRRYFSSPNVVHIPTSTYVKGLWTQMGLWPPLQSCAQHPSLLFCTKT